MYLSTRGIVFRQTRYSDTSLVVKILTEQLGLRSYIIKGARGAKSRLKASLFQPLTLLELVVSQNDKTELQHIREARPAYAYVKVPGDIRRSSILLFLNELLLKSIQEETVNPDLFGFVYRQLLLLDQAPEVPPHFHLLFALHLTRYLGFFPQGSYHGETGVFVLEEGHFAHSSLLPAVDIIGGKACQAFYLLLNRQPDDLGLFPLSTQVRNELLEKIIRYYQLHLPLQGAFKSHLVLHEVLQK